MLYLMFIISPRESTCDTIGRLYANYVLQTYPEKGMAFSWILGELRRYQEEHPDQKISSVQVRMLVTPDLEENDWWLVESPAAKENQNRYWFLIFGGDSPTGDRLWGMEAYGDIQEIAKSKIRRNLPATFLRHLKLDPAP